MDSSKFLGSTTDNSATFVCYSEHILLQVSTPASLFLIICFGECFFYTCWLGVLGGIYYSSSSYSGYGCSYSYSSSSSTSSSIRSSSSSYSFDSLLPSLTFCTSVLSIVTLILSMILLNLVLNHLYDFIMFEYPTSMPLST